MTTVMITQSLASPMLLHDIAKDKSDLHVQPVIVEDMVVSLGLFRPLGVHCFLG